MRNEQDFVIPVFMTLTFIIKSRSVFHSFYKLY